MLSRRFVDAADIIVDGMKLIVQVVERLVDSLAALCLQAVASAIVVRLISVSTPVVPFAFAVNSLA